MIGDFVVQVPRMQVMKKTVETPQLQSVEKTAEAETSNLQQFEGTLQAREKKLENDVTGRVSESCEHFQLGAQFRDTADEHSMQSTYTEHHYRDNTNVTMTTDERSNETRRARARRQQSNIHEIQKQNASNDRTRIEALDGRKHREIHSPQWKNRNARNNQALETSCHCPHRGQNARLRKEEGTEETG